MEHEQRQSARPRDSAVERIESYIRRHDLSVYGRLPSERDMCEMWDINRTTLRSAIRRLIEEGKLYNLKGSGTYVAPPRLERRLQEASSTTESVRDTGHYLDTRVLCAEVQECNKHISQKLQLPIGHRLFALRRLRLLDGSPYMIEHSYVELQRYPGIEEYDFSTESLYGVLGYYGETITGGEETIGVTYATEEEAQLLGLQSGDALFFLSGTAQGADGRPVEHFKSVVRADKVRFSSVLTRRSAAPASEAVEQDASEEKERPK